MSFGCSIYALSGAAADIRAGEPLLEWLKTQAALAVVWAPSEEAARYSAYLYCARLGYQPTEPASHYSPSPSAGSASLPGLGQAVRGKSTTCAALPPWGPVCQLRGRQRDPLSYSQQGESQREQRGADI